MPLSNTTPSASVLQHPVQKWPGHGHDSDFVHFINGTLTLANATTTTVSDSRILADAQVLLNPTSAQAALVVLGGTNFTSGIYVSSVVDGSFVVTHDAHVTGPNATFDYVVFNTSF
jgi:hypothetical protein